ncbi:MAG: hypothetical protein JWO71_3680 [Candidatus Acidoferrum typicum]|nr:hypothetical protein [Candidatus Acidoferrum typicum]
MLAGDIDFALGHRAAHCHADYYVHHFADFDSIATDLDSSAACPQTLVADSHSGRVERSADDTTPLACHSAAGGLAAAVGSAEAAVAASPVAGCSIVRARKEQP